jgi:predicted PurR-regulated permease PerM
VTLVPPGPDAELPQGAGASSGAVVIKPATTAVPALLNNAAAWAWRLIVVGVFFYFLVDMLDRLSIVTIPFFSAILLTALLYPLTREMRKIGLNRGLSTAVTVIVAFAVLGGVAAFVANRASAEYPELVDQVSRLVTHAQHWLVTGPLKLKPSAVNNISDKIISFLRSRQSTVSSDALGAATTLAEVLTSIILTFFLTVFMLWDGGRIWDWIVAMFPRHVRTEVRSTGDAMWHTLAGYIQGTFSVAAFHGIAMGTTLAIVGVPLVAPLAVLVFLGSFIPLIGAVVFGGLAVLVTLVAKGATAAIVVLVVLVIENQVEAHVLQPFVVGRSVRLHPMAIALVLGGGTVLEGIPGAIFAVPIVASINAAVRHLRAEEVPAPEPRKKRHWPWQRQPDPVTVTSGGTDTPS